MQPDQEKQDGIDRAMQNDRHGQPAGQQIAAQHLLEGRAAEADADGARRYGP
jgi:hypothetical protein